MHDLSSYTVVQAVTPHDSNPNVFPAFIVGVSGNVSVTDASGNTVTIACIAGHLYRIHVMRINATGTTATGIVGLT